MPSINPSPVLINENHSESQTPLLHDYDADLRRQTASFRAHHSNEKMRPLLSRFESAWTRFNEEYFEAKLVQPYIEISNPQSRRAIGDYRPVNGFGGKSGIRIMPSIVNGKHRIVNSGSEFEEGRLLFVLDILLHETIHQYAHEVLKNGESGYDGHGPVFALECNRIGAMLGLGPVRSKRKTKATANLPSCAYWPHNVRAKNYYLGAFVPPGDADLVVDAEQDGERRIATIDLSDPYQAARDLARLWDPTSLLAFQATLLAESQGGL